MIISYIHIRFYDLKKRLGARIESEKREPAVN